MVYVRLGSDDPKCPTQAHIFALAGVSMCLACVASMAQTLACSNVVAAPAIHTPIGAFHDRGNVVSVGLPLL